MNPGAMLGHYRVSGPLGAGGMGEVHRAVDSRLGRDVAVKILPAAVRRDPQRLARLEREARLLAALNHPHVATLHGLEEAEDGTRFVVMELVEGETLAARLSRGSPSLEEVCSWGAQIAEGLAAAHERGIVHRDLKPANVMLTRSGVKLIDFGLAKGNRAGPVTADGETQDETEAAAPEPLTREGALLGTLPHLAPEQLEGKEADVRSDLWAFGTVLYEMASGTPPFAGGSSAAILAAILKHEPPRVSEHRSDVPAAFDHLVATCLAKDPDRRRRSAADAALDLRALAAGGASASGPRAETASRARERFLWIAVAGLVLVATFPWLIRGPGEPAPDSLPAARFELPIDTYVGGSSDEKGLALSPRGDLLIYAAPVDFRSAPVLWTRRLGDVDAEPIPDTEGAVNVFFSPDGRRYGYTQDGAIKIADPAGGPPRVIGRTTTFGPPAWGASGVVLYAAHDESAGGLRIFRGSETGGSPERVALPESGDGLGQAYPHFLPDGRRFLYLAAGEAAGDPWVLWLGSLDGEAARRVGNAGSRVEYARGRLYYCEQGALLSRRFDPDAAALSGEPVLLGRLSNTHSARTGMAQFAVARTAVLAYAAMEWESELQWIDPAGDAAGTLGERGPFHSARISPSGDRLAMAKDNPDTGERDLWVFDLSRGVPTRLEAGPPDDTEPVWSPDGERLAYSTDAVGAPAIHVRDADGGGRPVRLQPDDGNASYPTDWSPDGEWVAIRTFRDTQDLFLLPAEGGVPQPYAVGPGHQSDARFSPDGQWIAFTSTELGPAEVFVAPRTDADVRRRVSGNGGSHPFWSPDGRRIFYVAGSAVLVASFSPASGTIGPARELFSLEDVVVVGMDIAPDGERFLATFVRQGRSRAAITMVLGDGGES